MYKVLYLAASEAELQTEVDRALEMIQTNIKNKVVDVKAIGDSTNGYTVQISYITSEDTDKKILLEGEEA